MVVGAGRTAAYAFGASSDQHRNLMAPHAAQWAAMQWAKAHGFERYDLWGMADPGDPADAMAGVHRFKLGFNPDLVTYPGAFDATLQPLRSWLLTGACCACAMRCNPGAGAAPPRRDRRRDALAAALRRSFVGLS